MRTYIIGILAGPVFLAGFVLWSKVQHLLCPVESEAVTIIGGIATSIIISALLTAIYLAVDAIILKLKKNKR